MSSLTLRQLRASSLCFVCCLLLNTPALRAALPDSAFVQESAEIFPAPVSTAVTSSALRSLVIDSEQRVWLGTASGVFRLEARTRTWKQMSPQGHEGPVFALLLGPDHKIYAGTWDGIQVWDQEHFSRLANVEGPVSALALIPGGVLTAGPNGVMQINSEGALPLTAKFPSTVRGVQVDLRGEIWIGSSSGLWHRQNGKIEPIHSLSSGPSSDVRALVLSTDGTLWCGGSGGVNGYRDGRWTLSLDPSKGLPDSRVQALGLSSENVLWIGTARGVARYHQGGWSLLHSRRWLLDDDVRSIAFDAEGSAWVATATGVSKILKRPLRLSEKESGFRDICLTRHIREPGIVEKCRLTIPGDLSSREPQDDDNDGGYTAVYLAMQSYRFAATGDPAAREQARQAFHALEFLQHVTGTAGFLARTVIPSTWTRMADPNEEVSQIEQAARRVEDGRFKNVIHRWRASADGRWLWKGDTSSDELSAHIFGYYFYYQLAAEDPERTRVREQVRKLVDHLIENEFTFRDLDGKHTRWGVWTPDRLIQDPNWLLEAGINAVELSCFLKVAHFMTGEARYQEHYDRLLRDPRWRNLIREAKNLNPATRTHIDDELLAFVYGPLLLLEKDPALKRLYRQSFDRWHAAVRPDVTPFFEMLYAAVTKNTRSLEAAVKVLRETPLDLIRWEVDNSHREDLRLVRTPELEHWQTPRLLPPSERGVPRTDDNPRLAVQGDGGRTESDGVFWLLPYWMGRYYGFIEAPR